MDGVLGIPAIIVVVVVCIAACTDLWSFKVPNILTLPFLVSGVIYHSMVHCTIGFQSSLGAALFAFGALILLYVSGGMGAGDVKLMAGVGAWVGVPAIMVVLLSSSIAAGAYALLLVLVHGRAWETCSDFRLIWPRLGVAGRHVHGEERVEAKTQRADRRQRLIPFAVMVALGVLATLVWYR